MAKAFKGAKNQDAGGPRVRRRRGTPDTTKVRESSEDVETASGARTESAGDTIAAPKPDHEHARQPCVELSSAIDAEGVATDSAPLSATHNA